tara:strand:- start:389 stop:610 length:222 start_codon:yes stop_codon:yes gene_type:complete
MANQRLQGGTYQATNSAGAVDKINIDDVWFEIPPSTTIKFDVQKWAYYDDTNVTVYKIPPEPKTNVSNVGDVL